MASKMLVAMIATLTVGAFAENAAASDVTYSCVCIGASPSSPYCGNNAIGGDYGKVNSGISTSDVISNYGPDRIGRRSTGWACMVEGTYDCACVGTPSMYACGNNAIGGDGGQVQKDISLANVIAKYGPNRIGNKATGWACILASN